MPVRADVMESGELSRFAAPSDQPAWPFGVSTAAGGLLFLLPVLARLGYPEWLEDAPEWTPVRVDRLLFGHVCQRLRLPADDPARWLARAPSRVSVPHHFRARSLWTDGIAHCGTAWRCTADAHGGKLWDASGRLLLAAWPEARRPAAFAALVAGRRVVHRSAFSRGTEDLADAAAHAWLTACRRWLRRYAGIGLASLAHRPGWVSLTPTHADVYLELSSASLAVRRAGLDLDPGWLSWFGRVVSFHYGRAPWT